MIKGRSKTIIIIGFVTILVILGSLIAIWLDSITTQRQAMHSVVDELYEVRMVSTMRDVALKRTITIFRMAAMEDPFDKDELYMELKDLAEKFIKARNIFLKRLTTKELEEWKKIRSNIKAGASMQNRAAELILEDRIDEALELLRDRGMKTQQAVLQALTKVINEHDQEFKEKLKHTDQQYHQTYFLVVMLGTTAVFVGCLVAFFVVRSSTKAESGLASQAERIRLLYEISSKSGVSSQEQMAEMLKLGCQLFNMEIGKICQVDIDKDTDTLLSLNAPAGYSTEPGTQLKLADSFCNIVIKSDEPIIVNHFAKSKYHDHNCYQLSRLESYIAVAVIVHNEKFGTVTFASRTPKSTSFTETDQDLIKLIGNWIGVTLEG